MKSLLKISVLSLLMFVSTQAYAWQMVYHHDANGNKIAGSLDTLKNAIRDGHKVRIARGEDGGFFDTVFLSIKNDYVFAQTTKIVALDYSNSVFKFYDNGYYSYYNLDTTGRISAQQVQLNSPGTVQILSPWTTEILWFID